MLHIKNIRYSNMLKYYSTLVPPHKTYERIFCKYLQSALPCTYTTTISGNALHVVTVLLLPACVAGDKGT